MLFNGIGASPGIVIGKALVVEENEIVIEKRLSMILKLKLRN